ncbi:MAG: hypothetical protein HRU69_03195 [Flammeovirgaceae bacterium]|nr:MAG: hypothetical protein HRU69_03195 [Flammeovirgaceae bacterium]
MSKKATPPKKAPKKPRVHKDLEGFELSVDQFGELKSNMDIEKLNAFLDKNVEDKKLAERDDYEELKKGKKNKKS